MYRSRQELRQTMSRLDASITMLHASHPADADFFQSTECIFSDVLAQSCAEDADWLLGTIDWICTRHGMPYPAH
jgi:hypothetical protein